MSNAPTVAISASRVWKSFGSTVDSLRELLDELHEARVAVEQLSIHTPDLDDWLTSGPSASTTGAEQPSQPERDNPPPSETRFLTPSDAHPSHSS